MVNKMHSSYARQFLAYSSCLYLLFHPLFLRSLTVKKSSLNIILRVVGVTGMQTLVRGRSVPPTGVPEDALEAPSTPVQGGYNELLDIVVGVFVFPGIIFRYGPCLPRRI